VGHIVAFEGADRVPAYHRCEELADAVSFVEKLRNDRGVETVQIFRTEEVRFDFKPYYRVELGALTAGSAPSASLPSAPAAAPAPAPAMAPPPPITAMATPDSVRADASIESTEEDELFDEHDDDLSASGSRRGLFGR
jgi:hypothetical protein